ncbi:MAG: CvpA family protein [Halofilum sp. (in: g-proteobacteria)]
MTGFDWIILVVIAVSGGISVIRGFVKEAISLATWIVAVWVALMFAPKLALLLPASWESPTVRWVAAAIGLFMTTLLVGGLANFLLSTMVEKTGLSGTDRALGVVFGILRGVAIVAVLVLLVSETSLAQEAWWDESRLFPLFEPLAEWMRTHYPADLAESMLSP